jgi:DNA polymerase III subunit alpha
VDTVMDLERARSRYAQAVKVQMNGNANAGALRAVLEAHRAKPDDSLPAPVEQARGRGGRDGGGGGYGGGRDRDRAQAVIPNGLAVQIVYRNERAEGEVRLGDAWRVKPTDDLLVALRGEFADSSVEIVY